MSFLGWVGMAFGLVGVEFGSQVGVDFGDYTANPQKSLDGTGASFKRRLEALPRQVILIVFVSPGQIILVHPIGSGTRVRQDSGDELPIRTLVGDLVTVPGHAFQLANDATPESKAFRHLGIRVKYVHETLLLSRRQVLKLAQASE